MTREETQAHVLALRNLFLDVLMSHGQSHPDMPAQLVLTALGETFINLGGVAARHRLDQRPLRRA